MSAITAGPSLRADLSTPAEQLRTRDPAALSGAYQAYGEQLFDYAMGMLGHREAAEDAVHDALLVASHRIGTLHRQDELPLWLYALTRNECLRQARRGRSVAADADKTVQHGRGVVVDQVRAWVWDAAKQLPPAERETLDLASRHGLTEVELGLVLGVPVKRAAALLSAACRSLERTLDLLLTARAGDGCADLDDALTGWDGRFSVTIRDRLAKHALSCRACPPATWNAVGAVELFGELPAELPPRLLERRLLATAAVPSRVASRADIAEPFERSGYPVPLDRARRWRPTLAVAGIVSTVLLGALGVWASQPEGGGLLVAADQPTVDLPPGGPVPVQPSAPVAASYRAQGASAPTAGPAASAAASAAASPSAAIPPPSPFPGAPAAVSPAVSPAAVPAPAGAPRPSPAPSEATQVDAVMADSTVGCGMWWKGTATGSVRGATAQSATLRWGATTAMPNSVPMQQVRTGTYQASPDDLPVNVTVFWQVVVVTTDGGTIATTMATIKHERQC